jgi:hypothetical protein
VLRELLTLQLVLLIGILVVLLAGCSTTIQKLDLSVAKKYEGFIQNRKTTKKQVQDRLGPPTSSYESGRIWIYHVFIDENGGMNRQGRGFCYACVLVFDNEDVLERHSLVKHGCQNKVAP